MSHAVAALNHQRDEPQFAVQIHVVPAFGTLNDHWTEEFKQELEANKNNPDKTIAGAMRPLPDFSFLVPDPLFYFGLPYAMSIYQMRRLLDYEQEYCPIVSHPVHISIALQETSVDNEAVKKCYEQMPSKEKQLHEYDCSHVMLHDGWVKDEVIQKQLDYVDKFIPK